MMRYLFRNNLAQFGTPAVSAVTSAGAKVSGHVDYYKDGDVGVAYRPASSTSWTYVRADGVDVEKTLTGLEPGTAYKACLYVKDVTGSYQRGTAVDFTTSNQ